MALSIQKQTFQCTCCPRSFTTGRGLQDINWLKKGMKSLLLLTPKQPHLSFQQTPHLLILLSGLICFPFIPVNPIPLKFLDESSQNDILPSSPEVIDLLKKKQSPAEPIQHGTLIQGPLSNNVDSIHFAAIRLQYKQRDLVVHPM